MNLEKMLRPFILRLAKKVAKSEKESLNALKRTSCIWELAGIWESGNIPKKKRSGVSCLWVATALEQLLLVMGFLHLTFLHFLALSCTLSSKLSKQTLKLLHQLHDSLSMGTLEGSCCWLFLQPRNRCWMWEICSVCKSHEGLKKSYLME